jgi:hypothetical protein
MILLKVAAQIPKAIPARILYKIGRNSSFGIKSI